MTAEESPARAQLRAAVRRSLERSDGPRPYLAGEATTSAPYDLKLWRLLVAEVGIAGLFVPEELGGAGADVGDAAVVAEELGRGLAPVPFFSTVALATSALLVHPESKAGREVLGRIAVGEAAATFGFCDTSGSWEVDAADVRAVLDASGWRLTGVVAFVVDGAAADVLLVPARTDDGIGVFVVEGSGPGLRRELNRSLDLTRPLATVIFEGAEALVVADPAPQVEPGVRAGLDIALALLAAEQVGAAQRCLDEAVAYVKQRVQFDRPIGSFQAIKHTLVDVLLRVELARSAAEVAVVAADAYLHAPGAETAAQLALASCVAKATCSEAYMHTAEETLHVFGGVGFTWEHNAHLHYRRAKAGELFLGTPHRSRDRLATLAGL